MYRHVANINEKHVYWDKKTPFMSRHQTFKLYLIRLHHLDQYM